MVFSRKVKAFSKSKLIREFPLTLAPGASAGVFTNLKKFAPIRGD
jgi:hypothetical protein